MIGKLTPREFVLTTVFSAIFYTVLLCLFMHFLAPKRVENCPRCKQAIANYKASVEAKQKPMNNKYQESLYNQGGGINPGFKKIVSNAPSYQEEPKQRAYEQQLQEYEAKLAELERKRLEEERQQAEEDARVRAEMEQERLERLAAEKALQKSQPVQVSGGVGPSKTFTAPKTKTSSKPATQQKTQIGTLKTSKLGESSFQK